MRILFRFNCGGMWGLGHLYRNLTLMNKLKLRGHKCSAVINENKTAEAMLAEQDFPVVHISEFETADELLCVVDRLFGIKNTVLFWDRLDSETDFIELLIHAGVRVVVYDDYHLSALAATTCINTRSIPVGGRIPEFSGPEYQLLRDEIRHYALQNKEIRKDVNKIVLHFGGTDPLDILPQCYEALKHLKEYQYEFIGGKEERFSVANHKNERIAYTQAVTDFGKRLYEADMCLVAGGVTMYEAAAIGTPMIVISHNEDQRFAASLFSEKQCCVNLGIGDSVSNVDICNSVSSLAEDYKKRQAMSMRSKDLVPSNGIGRVCDVIEKLAR